MPTASENEYSVPKEASELFIKGILANSKIPTLPREFVGHARHVRFEGSNAPSIPINWRFAESAAALKAFEATMLNVLRSRKYGMDGSNVSINTDHASLFFMSFMLTKVINAAGEEEPCDFAHPATVAHVGFPSTDLHRCKASNHRALVSNIYHAKDRYYHIHASMNPEPTLRALGMPLNPGPGEGDSYDAVVHKFHDVLSKVDSDQLDERINEDFGQAGTVTWTTEEYQSSQHGRANAHVGLYELHTAITGHGSGWWPDHESLRSSPRRPLAGLKVVDLTRVIAAPAITRSLAEMGASVMRVTGPITDFGGVLQDLNWGKWNCSLNLKDPEDREKLVELIKDADVIVESYRPGAMERNGFGRNQIFDMVRGRKRGGIIHVRENCYGWYGPWKHRAGWQQVSDANCGISKRYGEAMGLDEPVTPIFPNSDYCTGIIGSTAVLHALIRRAEEGGSFGVDVALNYYNQWLIESVGEYPYDVWSRLWQHHGKPIFRHYEIMDHTLYRMVELLKENDREGKLFSPGFMEQRDSQALKQRFVQLKPIARFEEDIRLGYNVGTRPNGVDQPHWPEDLTTEIIA